MKNNLLWYLSPIAIAFLSVNWMSNANFTNGSYPQSDVARTIQSESAAKHEPCGTMGARALVPDSYDENVTKPAHYMRAHARSQCPNS